MYSKKLTCLLLFVAVHLTNAQFGGGFGFPGQGFNQFGGGLSAGGAGANFANQNTNFQQNSGSSFGIIAGGSRGQSTNFQQSSNRGGIGQFGLNSGFGGISSGGFLRQEENRDELEQEEMEMSHEPEMRYASPYDIAEYTPKKPKAYPAPAYAPKAYAPPAYPAPAYAPKPAYPAYPAPVYPAPAPAYAPAYPPKEYTYPSPPPAVKCPQNLLIGCAPTVSTVPCSPPPAY